MPEVLPLDEARSLAERALERAGARPAMARATAEALVLAEAIGQAGHGLSRLAQYCAFLRNGRADGAAEPRVIRERGGAVLIDAAHGLAYPALLLAEAEAARRARALGVACVGITNSHHAGAMGLPVARLAGQGLVALAFTNSPAAMPVPGGRRPLLGTNPIAAAFPRAALHPPLIVDLALSTVARGRILRAAEQGEPIPQGWALDAEGQPTTDARAALSGAMLALGGDKGAALALAVELLCVALTGAAFGFEADSFFVEEGNRPRLGQMLLAIDPGALAGEGLYLSRIEALISEMERDPAVRIPGARRARLPASLTLPDPLAASLRRLAGEG